MNNLRCKDGFFATIAYCVNFYVQQSLLSLYLHLTRRIYILPATRYALSFCAPNDISSLMKYSMDPAIGSMCVPGFTRSALNDLCWRNHCALLGGSLLLLVSRLTRLLFRGRGFPLVHSHSIGSGYHRCITPGAFFLTAQSRFTPLLPGQVQK